MSIKTLKILRLFIPGLMILVVILTIQNADLLELSKALQSIDLSRNDFNFYIMPIILGAIYYALGFRNLFFKKPIYSIQKNIRERLVSEFDDDQDISIYSDRLRKNKKILQVFYNFIDSNRSLTEKSNNVRINGLFLSSFADACVISIFAILIYGIILFFFPIFYYVFLLAISILTFITSYFLFMPRLTKLHISYSNEQIDFIIANLRDDLKKALVNLIKTDYAD